MKQNLRKTLEKYYDYWFAANDLYEKWAKKYGLSANSLFLLEIINNNPGTCTQAFIVKKLLLPKQTVNSILAVWEKKDYIKKITDTEHDKRNKIIVFTQAGQAYADDIVTDLQQFELNALAKIGAKQRAALISSTHAFLQELQKSCN